MLVKICGITNLDDALLAAELGATALGFIFVHTSPRYTFPENAAAILRTVRQEFGAKAPLMVGVFVNTPREEILKILHVVSLDCLQFHGDEHPHELQGYEQRVWKAFRVSEKFQAESMLQYAAEAYVLDAYDPASYGGTGKTFNWQKAYDAKRYANIILSGGLKPQNILTAIRKVAPYGVDINSGVELVPGKKDHEKLRQLFSLLNTMEQNI